MLHLTQKVGRWGKLKVFPGAIALDRLRAKLSLSDEERTELNRVLDAYERNRALGRPAAEAIADIAKKL